MLRWMRSGSPIWSPIVNSGLSDIRGSCRIMVIWLPRTRCISRSDLVSRFSPANQSSPPTIRAAGGNKRRMESDVTVLPLPDSPTTPMVSPSFSVKLTPSTALTTRVPFAETK